MIVDGFGGAANVDAAVLGADGFMGSSERVSESSARPAEPRDTCVPEMVKVIPPCDITDSPMGDTVGTLEETVVPGRSC